VGCHAYLARCNPCTRRQKAPCPCLRAVPRLTVRVRFPLPARPAKSVAAQVDWLYLRPRKKCGLRFRITVNPMQSVLPSTDQAGAPFGTRATNVPPGAISNGFPAACSKTVPAVAPRQVELESCSWADIALTAVSTQITSSTPPGGSSPKPWINSTECPIRRSLRGTPDVPPASSERTLCHCPRRHVELGGDR
jgi:hypothetical protein